MKKSLLVLILAGACIVSCFTALADTPTAAPSAAHKEHHPAIRAAIRSLEHARAELKAASHDFGGHRADALAECDKAIEQLKLALQFDEE